MNRDASAVVGWHTSSYSANGNAKCVEVGWHTSSYSANGSAECVEVGPFLDGSARFAVRDSTQWDLGFLSFGRSEWTAFLRAAEREAL
ncbi:hypothetical protein HDA32_003973 [Spinactinospora alkalitolerans]|uniref:DUF397 domain-containing protein n=1 Tax=Spinactinospora alkalitolerans TaxID=687207 RepID=A0A852U1K0_9ACTN|nr:DUF397 domain-containing protein [Spinactinospora alkalitolerans]NYE48853.1 hypothetical protein [Spinactinospora alkalitolerans]